MLEPVILGVALLGALAGLAVTGIVEQRYRRRTAAFRAAREALVEASRGMFDRDNVGDFMRLRKAVAAYDAAFHALSLEDRIEETRT